MLQHIQGNFCWVRFAVFIQYLCTGIKLELAIIVPKMMAPETPATKMADVGDVVDVAVGNGAFTTLVKIVGDLGLVDTLKGVEAVTIIAPSDEALAKLPEVSLESLIPEQDKATVSRHVIAGNTFMAADVATGSVETFNSESVDLIKTEDGGVQISFLDRKLYIFSITHRG